MAGFEPKTFRLRALYPNHKAQACFPCLITFFAIFGLILIDFAIPSLVWVLQRKRKGFLFTRLMVQSKWSIEQTTNQPNFNPFLSRQQKMFTAETSDKFCAKKFCFRVYAKFLNYVQRSHCNGGKKPFCGLVIIKPFFVLFCFVCWLLEIWRFLFEKLHSFILI